MTAGYDIIYTLQLKVKGKIGKWEVTLKMYLGARFKFLCQGRN